MLLEVILVKTETKSKSISNVSLFYMEEDRAANQRPAFPLSLNIIGKH